MIGHHWFRLQLGAIREQAMTRSNVDPDLCRHMASLGQNELRNNSVPGINDELIYLYFDFQREVNLYTSDDNFVTVLDRRYQQEVAKYR